MALSSFNPEIRALQRLLVGFADDVDIDGSGRILVPPALRAVRVARASRRARGPGQQVRAVGRGEVERGDGARDHVSRGRAAARARRLLALMTAMARTSPSCSKKPSRALSIVPRGTYVDATFGRGGHARRILGRARRRGAARRARSRSRGGGRGARDRRPALHVPPRVVLRAAATVLAELGIDAIDGVLLDLGVSSPQIDDPARGFSLRADGPLDMRMDPARGESAADFLARADVRELTEVIRDYGEERFAQSIARAIVAARAVAPVVTTRQLAAIVAQAVRARPRGDRSQDPATRTFQALRIHVNRELEELALTLPRAVAAARCRRPPRGDQLPLARRPDREALHRTPRRSRSAAIRALRDCRSRTLRCRGRRSRASGARSARRSARLRPTRAREARRCASPSARPTRFRPTSTG